jgi:hypothetical protein
MRRLILFLAFAAAALAQTHSATLTWTNAAGNPTGTTVSIFRLTGSCPATEPTSTTGFTSIVTGLTGTTYVDTTVVAATTYCYVAVSVSGSSSSAPSLDAQGVVPSNFPPQMFSVSVN